MKLLIPIVLVSVLTPTWAYEPERAKNNFAHEAAECSAYFLFVSTAPGLSEGTAKGLRAKYEVLFKRSATVSSPQITDSRAKLALETMRREMQSDWTNLSIVNQKYGFPCIDFAKSPETRLQYWLDKKD